MNEFEKLTLELDGTKKRILKSFTGYSGIMISAFLMFVVVLIVTTEISLDFENIASIGMDFFLLLFCSYASYISCADSGMRAGYISTTYTEIKATFEEWYEKISRENIQCILGEFCADYIKEELKNARTYHLIVAGFSYEQYLERFCGKSAKDIDALPDLSKAQKSAIKAANKIKPIKLRPEMIIGHGGAHKRSLFPVSPEARKTCNFILKFVTISAIAFGMTLIGLKNIEGSGWLIFVSICFKLGSVLYNCFVGYKTGYENIVIHKVQYMREQVSLMKQACSFNAAKKQTKE